MLAALQSADVTAWLSIAVKVLAYATTLLAAGGVLAQSALSRLDFGDRAALARVTAFAAVLAIVFSVLRGPIRASFLAGGSLEGATDATILSLVAESPLGTSIGLRVVGLTLILAVLLRARAGVWIALVGAICVAVSFALRGHALSEPRLALGLLVTVHILGLAFWIGAFWPLLRAIERRAPEEAGALADEFGRKALLVVGCLVAAGVLLLVLLGVSSPSALSTPYGQGFALKLGIFAAILALAALNKRVLTPAMVAAAPRAGRRLKRSIYLEMFLILCVLAATAMITTLTSPPRSGEMAATIGDDRRLAGRLSPDEDGSRQ